MEPLVSTVIHRMHRASSSSQPRVFRRWTIRARRMDTVMKIRLERQRKEIPLSDVHFVRDKPKMTYKTTEVLNALRAFDIPSTGELYLFLKLNLGEKKDRLQHLRGTLLLPYSHGKHSTVLAFAEGQLAAKAKESGADFVGGAELIPLVQQDEIKFDHCVCSLDFLPKLKNLQNILRKRMPSIKRGSATDDLAIPIGLFKKGVTYEADREGRVSNQIGMLQSPDDHLIKNIETILQTLNNQRTVEEDEFFEKVELKGSVTPWFPVSPNEFL